MSVKHCGVVLDLPSSQSMQTHLPPTAFTLESSSNQATVPPAEEMDQVPSAEPVADNQGT